MRPQTWTTLAILLGAIAAASAPVARADYDTRLASRIGDTGAAGDGGSVWTPAISGDGRYIVFNTRAKNFPGRNPALASQIYRKDTRTEELVLVSSEDGPQGAPINGDRPAVSRDGRHVCWVEPFAGSPNETTRGRLVVRDVEAQVTRVVPGAANHGDTTAENWGYTCSLSRDGRKVVYTTIDAHASGDSDAEEDVYLYDFDSHAWTLISSRETLRQAPGLQTPRQPVITPDGRYVAFTGYDGDTTPHGLDTGGLSAYGPPADVYVRDVQAGTTELVSRPTGCESPDGSTATGWDDGDPHLPSISDDGRYVVFQTSRTLDPDNPPPTATETETGWTADEIYLRDRETCETHLISRASGKDGAIADQRSQFPSLSADGRFVAFSSYADNLDSDTPDSRHRTDVYIRDWRAGRTALVSRTSGLFGDAANGSSRLPALAAGKGRVAFTSGANNLTAAPTVQTQVYYRDILGSRGLLPADLPGKPGIAHASYRRGRSGAGQIHFDLSEYARVKVGIAPLSRKSRGVVKNVTGEEGANSISLDSGLSPGRYRLTIGATDFAHNKASQAVTVRVSRRRLPRHDRARTARRARRAVRAGELRARTRPP